MKKQLISSKLFITCKSMINFSSLRLDHPLHCGDGRLVGQCLHASTCSQPPSNSSIHGLTPCLVLLANHSHHSVVFSSSSSLVVTDASTDTLLLLPLLLVPLLDETSFSSLELGTLPQWRHRAIQSATTLCPSLLHAAEDSRESSWHA